MTLTDLLSRDEMWELPHFVMDINAQTVNFVIELMRIMI